MAAKWCEWCDGQVELGRSWQNGRTAVGVYYEIIVNKVE